MTPKPLSGTIVLDLTRYLAGPYCTLLLGGLGAEVIKIEPPGKGDLHRRFPPFGGPQGAAYQRQTADDIGVTLLHRARNKKSITLDLYHPEGRELFKTLCRKADVVAENYSPGVMDEMGVSYAVLKELNHSLILYSIPGFGWWQRECEAMGLPAMPHDERYHRSEEFLTILKGLWTQWHFSFTGRFCEIADVTLAPFPVCQPHPTIYLGGESDEAQRLAARFADVYLINGRPVAETKTLVERVRALAAAEGRDIQFGISAFVICRETMAAAQAEHARLYALRSEEAIPGVDRQVVMIRTYAYAHGYVGSNGGTAAGLVGTPQDIAGRLKEFLEIGVTTFLLQFHPMLEEMARFGEQVVPLLARAGMWIHPNRDGYQRNTCEGGVS